MANVGDTRIAFGRSYVYLNPDTTPSTPEVSRPGTWRLEGEFEQESAPVPPVGLSTTGVVGGSSSVESGQLLYVNSDGELELAKATDLTLGTVAGVAVDDGNVGDTITYTRNEVIDFFEVASLVDGGGDGGLLIPGVSYYLSNITAGNWTNTPNTTNPGVVTQVGLAVGYNKMSIEIQEPLVL